MILAFKNPIVTKPWSIRDDGQAEALKNKLFNLFST